ncbi:MAG: hypothetical protein DRP87_18510 [Spirochaetes bacterium]|nr:MAG: hypothetical protein DRP87_18510 [Spirochaetota bacterium]
MKITRVSSRRELKEFIFFPASLYQDDPFWVPPLWWEERKSYNKKNNPILKNTDFILLLAKENGRVVARNLVYIDYAFNKYYRSRVGFFGAFESINDSEIVRLLMKESEKWLASQGMESIRGPIHPVAENWGFLYEGFESSPVYLSPYNFRYYNDLFDGLGYRKAKDLLAYEASGPDGYIVPERFFNFYNMFLKRRPNFSLRKLRIKDLEEDAKHIWHLANESLKNNWGYVPVDYNVVKDMIKRLRLIVDVDAVWFVEDRGEPVAFCLGYPDLNIIIKEIRGCLFPAGFIKILLKNKRLKDYRLFALAVHPGYHSLGLDVLLYVHLYNSLSPKKIRLEVNYILEDNYRIKNAVEKLKLRYIKKYRIYEKEL